MASSSSASANSQDGTIIGKNRPNKYTIISCIIASSGALLFGLDVGVSCMLVQISYAFAFVVDTDSVDVDNSLSFCNMIYIHALTYPTHTVFYRIPTQITGGVLASKSFSLFLSRCCRMMYIMICDMYNM